MDRSHAIGVLLCLIGCGNTTPAPDGSSIDATIPDGMPDDAGASDVIEEWRMCSFDGALRGNEAGVGQYYSCCAGALCYGDCVGGGTPHCDCGGINGGCENPSRCCGQIYADVLLLSCGPECITPN